MNKIPDKPLLRPKEVADYFDVTVRTVYNWIYEGVIDSVKIRGTIRIETKSVVIFLENKETS